MCTLKECCVQQFPVLYHTHSADIMATRGRGPCPSICSLAADPFVIRDTVEGQLNLNANGPEHHSSYPCERDCIKIEWMHFSGGKEEIFFFHGFLLKTLVVGLERRGTTATPMSPLRYVATIVVVFPSCEMEILNIEDNDQQSLAASRW